jgi:hypothetical protein
MSAAASPSWGYCYPNAGYDPRYDLDVSGFVDVLDVVGRQNPIRIWGVDALS